MKNVRREDVQRSARRSAGATQARLQCRRLGEARPDRYGGVIVGGMTVLAIPGKPTQVLRSFTRQTSEYLILPADFVASRARHRELRCTLLDTVWMADIYEPAVPVAQPDEEVGDMITLTLGVVGPQQRQRLRGNCDDSNIHVSRQ